MRKCLKCALEIPQIETKNKYDFIDGYEVHLYGDDRDRFEYVRYMEKPLVTVHYPLKRCDVLQIAHEFESDYTQKVFAFCKEQDVGLVLHAESPAYNVFNIPEVDRLCANLKEYGIKVHVENMYVNIGATEALRVMQYLRHAIGKDKVFPLLDTCHLMMSEMSFKFEEMSFSQAIESYKSSCFKMHLNDCIGSGEKETGGIHGTNFRNNLYLLNNILWKLYTLEEQGYVCDCVLEINETDYISNPAAVELAHNIDKFWNMYIEQDRQSMQ